MPVFHEARCVFVHIPKTAGKAVEAAFLGPGAPGAGRRSWLNRAATAAARLSRPRSAETRLIGTLDRTFAAQHLTYGEMQALGLPPPETLAAYDVFCVVRNPFDRLLSLLDHHKQAPELACLRLEEWTPAAVERAVGAFADLPADDHNRRAMKRTQTDFTLDLRGRPAIGHVLRFETLAADFEELLRVLGRPPVGSLPERPEHRDRTHWTDLYTDAARRRVAKDYAEDFDRFRYSDRL